MNCIYTTKISNISIKDIDSFIQFHSEQQECLKGINVLFRHVKLKILKFGKSMDFKRFAETIKKVTQKIRTF